MGLFRKRDGGNIGRGLKLLDKAADIGKEAVIDQDKLNDLRYTLIQARTELMLKGKGASITKTTINGLVAFVVGVGGYLTLKVLHFLLDSGITEESLEMAKVLMGTYRDYDIPAVAAIVLIAGGFVTGSSLKRTWGNGNGN